MVVPKGQFHLKSQVLRLFGGLFFNNGPGLPQPASNGFLAALFRTRFRLLATPSHSGQNIPDMTRMVVARSHFFDDHRYAVERPDIGGIACSNRPFEQNCLDVFFLFSRELCLLARMPFGLQPFPAELLPGFMPLANSFTADVESTGDFGLRDLFFKELRRSQAAAF